MARTICVRVLEVAFLASRACACAERVIATDASAPTDVRPPDAQVPTSDVPRAGPDVTEPTDASPADAPPRPIAPMSLSSVSGARPTFRWAPAARTGATRVQVCRDRACASVVAEATVTGSTWQPASPLPRGLYHWRLFGVRDGVAGDAASAVWPFHVESTGAAAGSGLAVTLDVNGDGYADLLVSSPGSAPGGRDHAGEVRVYLGSREGLSPTPHRVLEGAVAGDAFGWNVAKAGDVNGDGFDDALITRAGFGVDAGYERASYVYLGSATGPATQHRTYAVPVTRHGFIPISIAGAGDVNGDGYADVLVGVSGADAGGRSEAGVAFLYFGGRDGLPATPQRTLEGGAPADFFGQVVAGLGDVNGDGYADVAITSGRNGETTVNVFFGSAEGPSPSNRLALTDTAPGDDATSGFANSVAGAGDVNGDGYADVVVGAPTASPAGVPMAGRAFVFLGGAGGLSTTAHRTLEGRGARAFFGASVATAGDVNGDGYADVIVGAPAGLLPSPAAATAYVYLGGAAGLASTASAVAPAFAQSRFGSSVASIGDLDGDGYADVVVGADTARSADGSEVGAASVYRGGAAGLGATAHRAYEGASDGDRLGTSVARAVTTPRRNERPRSRSANRATAAPAA